jgi:hypothetical protein
MRPRASRKTITAIVLLWPGDDAPRPVAVVEVATLLLLVGFSFDDVPPDAGVVVAVGPVNVARGCTGRNHSLLRMMIFLVTSTIPVVLLMLSRRRRGRRVVHVVAVNVGRRQLLLSASVGRRVMIVLAPLLGTTGDGTGAIVLVTLHRSGTLPLASVLLGVLAAAPSWSLVGFFRGSMVPRIPGAPDDAGPGVGYVGSSCL